MSLSNIYRGLFVISIVGAMAFTTGDFNFKNTSITVTDESSVVIRGTTSINTFKCSYNVLRLDNPIQVVYRKVGHRMVFDKTALVLDKHSFDCGGKGINNDFQKILKSNKYPEIILYLNYINHLEDQPNNVLASIDIEIAGFSKTHKVPVKIKKSNNMIITGDLAISMSDYNLEAPKKLFGLISVDDTINVYFQLAVVEN